MKKMPQRTTLAITASAFVAPGGCNSTPDPGSAPDTGLKRPSTSSSTPTPTTPSATSTTPDAPFDPVPEAARAHTNEGAMAFALYFIEQSNKAFMHPRKGAFARLCTPKSKLCASLESDIDYYAENGWHSDGPVGLVKGQQIAPRNDPSITSVGLDHYITAYNIVDSHGVIQQSANEEPWPMELLLIWSNEGWLVNEIATRKA